MNIPNSAPDTTSRRTRTAPRAPLVRTRARRWSAVLCSVALATGGGLAAAGPASGAGGSDEYIVVLKDSVRDVDRVATAQSGAYGLESAGTYSHALNGYAATLTAADAARLGADPTVEFLQRQRDFELVGGLGIASAPVDAVEDPAPAAQLTPLSLLRIGGVAPETAAVDAGPQDLSAVNVAVIDTGIDGTHPDLNARWGADCSSGTAVVSDEVPVDPHGHGTQVAGVIAAMDNGFGVVGAAPGATLWSVRVMNDAGGITEASLICAADWVASTHTDDDETNDIAVANISITGPGSDPETCGGDTDALHRAICRSVEEGVAWAAAAGNARRDLAASVPATYSEVLAATAMADYDGVPGRQSASRCENADYTSLGRDDGVATFSNYATQAGDRDHTVAAPGVCVSSTYPGGQYAVANGTSFASPYVAGSIALCIGRGTCGGSGAEVAARFLELTAEYNQEDQAHGFSGDPIRPPASSHYGYLVHLAAY
ncbi:S8 family serine peptidase [Arthrobacter sp.]|uniref:S8 family serine peptidase n=1 Tax=Arthrobacter sp. TaxID=1667 RepID=UPI00366FEA09